jgi:hypothetical protein
MLNQRELNELENRLQKLVGETCDNIYSFSPQDLYPTQTAHPEPYLSQTVGDGYALYYPLLFLEFGSDRIDKDEPRYQLGLLGTWHIMKNAKSQCAYIGIFDTDGNLSQQINILTGHRVTRVFLLRDKLNLFVEFDHHYWLAVFNSERHPSFTYSETTYSLGMRSSKWTVNKDTISYSLGMN